MFTFKCCTYKTDENIESDNTTDVVSTGVLAVRDKVMVEIADELAECIFPLEDIVDTTERTTIHNLIRSDSSSDSSSNDSIASITNNVVDNELEYVLYTQFHAHSHITYMDTIDNIDKADGDEIYIGKIDYLNSKMAFSKINRLCGMYHNVLLIKPTLTSPIDETIYIACTNDESVSISEVKSFSAARSYNNSGIIDFMYCCYHFALYIARVCNKLDEESAKPAYTQYIKQLLNTLHACDIPLVS